MIQPLYVRQILHGSVSVYAWTLTAFALGGLTSGLAASALPPRALTSRLAVPAGALAVAAGELAFTATASLSVALIGSALWGASAAAFTISSRSLMLSAAPPSRHGQAMTIWRSIQSMSYLAPATIIGSLVLALGLRTSLHTICLLAGITGAAALGQTISPRGRSRPG
jgi:predicted MFS family arabinose efflux permease